MTPERDDLLEHADHSGDPSADPARLDPAHLADEGYREVGQRVAGRWVEGSWRAAEEEA